MQKTTNGHSQHEVSIPEQGPPWSSDGLNNIIHVDVSSKIAKRITILPWRNALLEVLCPVRAKIMLATHAFLWSSVPQNARLFFRYPP